MPNPDVFEASDPFAFFDYLRVPHRVVPAARPRPVRDAGILWPSAGGPGLSWCRAVERPRRERAAGRCVLGGNPGCIPLAGHVVPDAVLDHELDSSWVRADAVLDAAGQP